MVVVAQHYRIVIGQHLSHAMQLGVLLHELRHLDQFARAACPSDELSVREYARAAFAMEEDASAISLMMTWDMKERGQPGPWQALSQWSGQADIAKRFSDEITATGDVAGAVSAAFDQWYASSERRHRYYIAVCGDYLDQQDESHALPRYGLVTPVFYEQLCRLPDGSTYPCVGPEIDLRGN